uniref:Uncharacterized protein n=1 Tax=Timema douglasi TaxID=61478 RepID=A0A7R8VGN3_TIMDO|nr:unnamed protein product [Timema douglasi]
MRHFLPIKTSVSVTQCSVWLEASVWDVRVMSHCCAACWLHVFSRWKTYNKRRKWLPPPLRKLSQGKVEKGTPSTAPDRPTLKKTGSDKRFKLAHALPNVLKCFNQGYGHACDLVAAFYDQMLSWHQGVKMCY